LIPGLRSSEFDPTSKTAQTMFAYKLYLWIMGKSGAMTRVDGNERSGITRVGRVPQIIILLNCLKINTRGGTIGIQDIRFQNFFRSRLFS